MTRRRMRARKSRSSTGEFFRLRAGMRCPRRARRHRPFYCIFAGCCCCHLQLISMRCFCLERCVAMTSIASTNTSGVLASLVDSASGSAPSAANTSAQSASLTTSGSGDPVDIVDLSDRAKQILARANVEQAAADKLSGFLQSLKDPTGFCARAGLIVQQTKWTVG